MTPFEFDFTLFGLVLGFSLVEVLGGLARALNARIQRPLGLLTPLLALFVLLDITGFWSIAWRMRDVIPPYYAVLVVGLAITGLYYVAASLVFPSAEGEAESLDAHYFRVKSKVFAIVLACQLLAHASRYVIMGPAAFAEWTLAAWVVVPAALVLMAIAIVLRGRTPNAIVLGLLIAFYLADAASSLS